MTEEVKKLQDTLRELIDKEEEALASFDYEGPLAIEGSIALNKLHDNLLKCHRLAKVEDIPLLEKITKIVGKMKEPHSYSVFAYEVEMLRKKYLTGREAPYSPDNEDDKLLDDIFIALDSLAEQASEAEKYVANASEEDEDELTSETLIKKSSDKLIPLLKEYEKRHNGFVIALSDNVPIAKYPCSEIIAESLLEHEKGSSLVERINNIFNDYSLFGQQINLAAYLIRIHIETYCKYVLHFDLSDSIFFELEKRNKIVQALSDSDISEEDKILISDIYHKSNPGVHDNMSMMDQKFGGSKEEQKKNLLSDAEMVERILVTPKEEKTDEENVKSLLKARGEKIAEWITLGLVEEFKKKCYRTSENEAGDLRYLLVRDIPIDEVLSPINEKEVILEIRELETKKDDPEELKRYVLEAFQNIKPIIKIPTYEELLAEANPEIAYPSKKQYEELVYSKGADYLLNSKEISFSDYSKEEIFLRGFLYEFGIIYAKNDQKAYSYYKNAKDYPPSFNNYAHYLEIGTKQVKADKKEAVKAYEEAIKNEEAVAEAHYNLARHYEASGHKEKALHHYAKAAEKDHLASKEALKKFQG